MSWNDLSQNPRVIFGYYSTPPRLDQVEVISLALLRDGPTLEVVVELATFPDRRSPRWDASANAAQARFRFFSLREVRIEGWGTTNIGSLSLSPVAGGVQFEFHGGDASCVGVSEFFYVMGVSVYTDSV
jgi:Immunity protein 50